MATKHLDEFGEEECKACEEIAKYKWRDGYTCKRPGCGCDQSREGATPYSKQCKKCNRDESATAHTVFDKLRISRAAALALVKEMMKTRKRLTIDQLMERIVANGHTDINRRSVWSLVNKVYDKIPDNARYIYDESAVMIIVFKKPRYYVISKGLIDGAFKFNATDKISDRKIHVFVKRYTTEQSKVALYFAKNLNSSKERIQRMDVSYRPSLSVAPEAVRSIALNFHFWTDRIAAYLYKKNGGTYDDLMYFLCQPRHIFYYLYYYVRLSFV